VKPITELHRVSLAIWDHSVLLVTQHKQMHLALTPAIKADTQFTNPGGTKG